MVEWGRLQRPTCDHGSSWCLGIFEQHNKLTHRVGQQGETSLNNTEWMANRVPSAMRAVESVGDDKKVDLSTLNAIMAGGKASGQKSEEGSDKGSEHFIAPQAPSLPESGGSMGNGGEALRANSCYSGRLCQS